MEYDETHALEHPLLHAVYDGVLHPAVSGVAPPGEHVGIGKHFFRETVLRFLERGGRVSKCGDSFSPSAMQACMPLG